jgi:phosphoesterase RecJ-like protein
MNSQIATFLLTGLITDTNSFFNTNSSSKALQTAGELMTYKPRHQDIIINLFKKKPYPRIKLWGTILEGLKDIE